MKSNIPRPPSSSTQQQQQQPRVLLDFSLGTVKNNSHKKNSNSSGKADGSEDDWDLLSDRFSRSGSGSFHNNNHNNVSSAFSVTSSNQGGNGSVNAAAVFVPKAGSVRSINTCDFDQDHSNSSGCTGGGGNNGNNGPPSFKIQRTHSNSTIDSNDESTTLLGPSGKGVLGVDYVEHVILPTDTLQGICIAYKISTTRLRQANHFSGNSLLLAPKKLVIPISKQALRSGFIRVQDTDAKEYKLYSFLAEFPKLNLTEAKAYLELSDWDLKHAIQSAKEDVEWEREMNEEDEHYTTTDPSNEEQMTTSTSSTANNNVPRTALSRKKPNAPWKSGEIRITSSANGGYYQARGAGLPSTPPPPSYSGPSNQQQNGNGPSSRTTTNTVQQPQEKKQSSFPYSFTSPFTSFLSVGGGGSRNSTQPKTSSTRIVSPTASRDEEDDHHNEGNDNHLNGAGSTSSTSSLPTIKMVPPPAISTKSVQPHDVYHAAPQHDNYGVELKPVSSFSQSLSSSRSPSNNQQNGS